MKCWDTLLHFVYDSPSLTIFLPQAANVLLRSCESELRGVTAKIADFGMSFKLEGDATHMSLMCCGTLAYMAPEALLEGHKNKASDV